MDNVVITGMGIVCSIANNIKEYRYSLKEGMNGISHITKYDIENEEIKIGGEIKNLSFIDFMSVNALREYGIVSKFGIVSSRQALEDSNINLEKNSENIAVISASALGEFESLLKYINKIDVFPKRANLYNNIFTNDVISSAIAVELGIKGANYSVSCGCSSFSMGIIEAINILNSNNYKYVLVCGAEAPINKYIIKSFNMSNLLTKNKIKPFDINADGFALSEGSAAIVLEKEKDALERGAKIYCKISGAGCYCDAFSIYSEPPNINGKKKAVEKALKDCGNLDIDYINAYGSGLKYIDNEEIDLINDIFKEKANELYISSTKSMIGHMLGASAGAEIISSILGFKYDFLLPTINFDISKSNLNFVPNNSINKSYNRILKLSYASGNKNTAIVLEKYNL